MPSRAQVVVEQQLSTSSILIGEQVLLQTRVAVDSGSVIRYPQFQHQVYIPGVEILKEGKVDTTFLNDGRRIELKRAYLLTSFDSALYALPPFAVVVDKDTFRASTSVGLKVGTVPVDIANANDFAGPHDVINIEYEWSAELWSMLLFVVLLVVVVVVLVNEVVSRIEELTEDSSTGKSWTFEGLEAAILKPTKNRVIIADTAIFVPFFQSV
jgi:hypothetical protein